MNILLTSLLLGLSAVSFAQQSRTSNLWTSIDDDDKIMAIRVEGTVNGKDVSYRQRFKVAGMSDPQKDALKKRIMDSLGVGEVEKPPAPSTPPRPLGSNEEATVSVVCEKCMGKGKLSVSGDGYSLDREFTNEGDKQVFPMQLNLPPGDYRLVYWQNKVLQIQSTFTVKAGEPSIVKVK